jgi:hypothetical protein
MNGGQGGKNSFGMNQSKERFFSRMSLKPFKIIISNGMINSSSFKI